MHLLDTVTSQQEFSCVILKLLDKNTSISIAVEQICRKICSCHFIQRNYANAEEQEISLCVPKLKTNQNIMLRLILDSPKLYSGRRGDIWIIHDPLEPKKMSTN
jgi:hypothetical protein